MRPLCLPALAAALALPTAAFAGPLAQTARAVDNHQDTHESSSSSSSSEPDRYEPYYDDHSGEVYVAASASTGVAAAPSALQQGAPPPAVGIDLALQSVSGSDAAGRVGLSLGGDLFGVAVKGERYVEDIASKSMSDRVHVDLWSILATGRIVDLPRWRADLWLGGGGTASSEFAAMQGLVFGGALAVDAAADATVETNGRVFFFDDGLRVHEAVLGLRANDLFWVGYRAMKFSVGPVLHGPEAGLSIRL